MNGYDSSLYNCHVCFLVIRRCLATTAAAKPMEKPALQPSQSFVANMFRGRLKTAEVLNIELCTTCTYGSILLTVCYSNALDTGISLSVLLEQRTSGNCGHGRWSTEQILHGKADNSSSVRQMILTFWTRSTGDKRSGQEWRYWKGGSENVGCLLGAGRLLNSCTNR